MASTIAWLDTSADDRRLPELDLMRPPAGFTLDLAVGTSFTLDLHALLAVPMAFGRFEPEREDLAGVDQVEVSEAVAHYASRIDVFCQAGEIVASKGYRRSLACIEDSVHEVRMPPGVVFHPKLWVLRFTSTGEEKRYRVLCGSRNVAFDRSWDTVVSLDGIVARQARATSLPLADFVRRLPKRAVWPVRDERAREIAALADELEFVSFDPPDGFDNVRFHALEEGAAEQPFSTAYDRMLVVSPVLSQRAVSRLSSACGKLLIVSCPKTLDEMGAASMAGAKAFVQLSEPPVTTRRPEAIPLEELAGDVAGLHAQLYVTEKDEAATVWVGSANATNAGLAVNTAFLVALEAPAQMSGVDPILGRLGPLESYRPAEEPREPDDEQVAQRRLNEIVRRLATIGFTAVIEPDRDGDMYGMRLTSSEPLNESNLYSIDATMWPMTLSKEAAGQRLPTGEVDLHFGVRPVNRITPFFFIELTDPIVLRQRRQIVISAQLTGAPRDRRERVLNPE